MELLTAIQQRRTVRAFRPDPVPENLIEEIFAAGTWAPSHGNKQPWEFVIPGPDTRAKLAANYLATMEAGPLQNPNIADERKANMRRWAQNFGDAPLLFAVACPPAASKLDEYDFPLAAAAALQNIFLAAWAKGLAGIWLSMGRGPAVKDLLQVPPEGTIAGIVAMGYPKTVPAAAGRTPPAEKIRRLP